MFEGADSVFNNESLQKDFEPFTQRPVVFGRVKLDALFSHVTEVKFKSDNCIL